jgi:SAM-dependent methyltransferase
VSLKFHEIAESYHRILNPFTQEKLMLVGEICRLNSDMHQLDLCCGKAEMLCQWSHRWGIRGTGVDISSVFLTAAHQRALELGVADRITFIEGDAAKYTPEALSYDVVSCIGATWIGDGLVGTLKLMEPALKPGGLLLVGEPYWIAAPPEAAYELMEVDKDDFTSLIGMLDRIESVGLELVEMVLADTNSWDRYVASQWLAIDDWLRANPDHDDAQDLHAWNVGWKRLYLEYQREYLGWGVFVLRRI